jgi:phosphatidylethanolamine/phosphatidyl-N-methylethanolamine N-methyltransferase
MWMLKDIRLFYSAVREDFQSIGAIAPSSSLLAKAIIHPLSQRPPCPISVLEVGPGIGSFTSHILKHLRQGDVLEVFEVNSKFCLFLTESLKKARLGERGIRWEVHNADIRTLDKSVQYDYIISGLPLNNFHPEAVADIFDVLMNHLSPTGVFSYFEYLLLQDFKTRLLKKADRDRTVRVVNMVKTFNRKHQYQCDHVWLNLPPAKARHCRKSL